MRRILNVASSLPPSTLSLSLPIRLVCLRGGGGVRGGELLLGTVGTTKEWEEEKEEQSAVKGVTARRDRMNGKWEKSKERFDSK